MSFQLPRAKFEKLRRSPGPQLWVVCYVNQTGGRDLIEDACRDLDAVHLGGADGAVLINEWCRLLEFEPVVKELRVRYPGLLMGVNYLGDKADTYGFHDSFRIARENKMSIVWTDFSGVDLIHERESIDLHEVEASRDHNSFYASGVHMKYSTLRDPEKSLEQSALQAMGWVDGIVVTGLQTGVKTDPAHVRRVRAVVGDYPVGVGSGVSAENVGEIRSDIDFALVASSLQDADKRIVLEKVRKLKSAMQG